MRDAIDLVREIGAGANEPPVLLEQQARRALLAAIAREERRARVRRLRRPLALGLAFAVTVSALLVAVLARGDSPSVAARAYAAISVPSGVMHFVAEQPPPEISGTNRVPRQALYQEYWIDLAHPKRQRIVTSVGGRAVSQYVIVTHRVPGGGTGWGGPNAVRTSIMQAAPRMTGSGSGGSGGVVAGQNPLAAYRDLLKNGVVLSDKETTYAGRDAYELVVQFKPPYDLVDDVWPGDIESYTVDRATYFPLESTFQLDYTMGGTMKPILTRFPLFEILPATPASLALLRPVAHPQPYPR